MALVGCVAAWRRPFVSERVAGADHQRYGFRQRRHPGHQNGTEAQQAGHTVKNEVSGMFTISVAGGGVSIRSTLHPVVTDACTGYILDLVMKYDRAGAWNAIKNEFIFPPGHSAAANSGKAVGNIQKRGEIHPAFEGIRWNSGVQKHFAQPAGFLAFARPTGCSARGVGWSGGEGWSEG
jgi:hypothetical protein